MRPIWTEVNGKRVYDKGAEPSRAAKLTSCSVHFTYDWIFHNYRDFYKTEEFRNIINYLDNHLTEEFFSEESWKMNDSGEPEDCTVNERHQKYRQVVGKKVRDYLLKNSNEFIDSDEEKGSPILRSMQEILSEMILSYFCFISFNKGVTRIEDFTSNFSYFREKNSLSWIVGSSLGCRNKIYYLPLRWFFDDGKNKKYFDDRLMGCINKYEAQCKIESENAVKSGFKTCIHNDCYY